MLQWFDKNVMPGKALSAVVPLVLLGCSTMPLGSGDAQAQTRADKSTSAGSSVQSNMDSQLMFELMIAELAGRRGQLDVALAGYLRASESTTDPRVSEQAARLAMFGRQWSEAEGAAKRWIELDAENTDAPKLLALALLRQQRVDAAVQIYTELLVDSDEKRSVLSGIQIDLQNNNNSAHSVSVMQSLSDAFPMESEAHLGLARAHITDSRPDAALLAIERAVELAPEDTGALLLRAQILAATGETDAALASLSTSLDANPDNTRLRLGFTQLLVDSGRYDEAGAQMQIIHAESAGDAQTQLSISLLALEAQQIEQASAYLTDLLNTGQYPDQANFYLGRISDREGEFAKAIEFYDAVNDGELVFNARLRAAELTALEGELEQGRTRLQDLAANVPSSALQPRIITAESRMLQNNDQNAAAVNVLTAGLESFPENTDLMYSRALAADAAGDEQLMMTDLERLIELDSENAHALNALGYHFADNNIELERAEQLLEKAIDLLPDDPAIIDSLGWLRYRQGRYAESVEILQRAFDLFPDPEIAAHLVRALAQSGQEAQAQLLLQSALETDPEDERLLAVQNDLSK